MSMRRFVTATGVALLLLASSAGAQTGNPAGGAPGTATAAPGAPAAHQPNQADRIFIREATIGGMAEVETGKLAEQKGQSDAVKAFGRQMVHDHMAANDRLAALAKADNVPAPSGPDPDHRAMHDQLQKATDGAFDRAYIEGQVTEHQRTAQLLEYEIGSGQDPELRRFAAETLPTVLQHLQQAQLVAAQIVGQAPPASVAPTRQGASDGSRGQATQPGGAGGPGQREQNRPDRPPTQGGAPRGTTR
jgi:putative membrane protein